MYSPQLALVSRCVLLSVSLAASGRGTSASRAGGVELDAPQLVAGRGHGVPEGAPHGPAVPLRRGGLEWGGWKSNDKNNNDEQNRIGWGGFKRRRVGQVCLGARIRGGGSSGLDAGLIDAVRRQMKSPSDSTNGHAIVNATESNR